MLFHFPPFFHFILLLYFFQHRCTLLINYKVSVNKREQLFPCSAISLAKAAFVVWPSIYHHSTLVRLEPLHAPVRASPIKIMDSWVDAFLSSLNNAVIYMPFYHFSVLQAVWMQLINPKSASAGDFSLRTCFV